MAPIAFLAALVFLGTRTCNSELANVELRFDVGTARPTVISLQVDLAPQDKPNDTLGHFEHNFETAPASLPANWKLQLDPGIYVLTIAITTTHGIVRETRTAKAVDNAVIHVSLERTLAKPIAPREPN